MIFEAKRALRRTIKAQTATLSPADKHRQALLVTTYLCEIISHMDHPVVALFSPLSDELPLDVAALSKLCRVVLPKVDTTSDAPLMEFYPYSAETLSVGAYGISEPVSHRSIAAEDIDLAIIPGVAFSSEGYRLGRGKGYYDCYLSREGFRAETIGVCFNHQLLADIPTEPHDKRVKRVITASYIEQKD